MESPAGPTRDDIARWRENWRGEVEAATLYDAMADAEEDGRLGEVYRRLAAVEQRHAAHWESLLDEAGASPGRRPTGLRTRLLTWTARRFGTSAVLPMVVAAEQRDAGHYDDQPEATAVGMPADERSHARILGAMRGGLQGEDVARAEGRHRSLGGNAIRAAVLGANDGLVSNLSLVMGVAGAALEPNVIVVTGLAGLLAGSGSMALGEWISVQSAREVAEQQLRVEREELLAFPEEEREELRLIYEAKGLEPAEAEELADRLLADPDTALGVLAREELGIDPDDVGNSPWEAAGYSFVLFALGAIIPVLPYLFTEGAAAIAISVAASGVGLFLLGAAISLLSARHTGRTGLRQLAIGLAAAAVTYGAGTALGVTIA